MTVLAAIVSLVLTSDGTVDAEAVAKVCSQRGRIDSKAVFKLLGEPERDHRDKKCGEKVGEPFKCRMWFYSESPETSETKFVLAFQEIKQKWVLSECLRCVPSEDGPNCKPFPFTGE